ncbi:hypothetical protein C0993_009925 [Termitomyces sp. T159_Od127]|nr:hypothetical protein C0993_009925 [Termitomyces sp. T159_Od127]
MVEALIQSRDITLVRSPPKVYKPGTRLTLTLPEHNDTLKVEILKAFNPFTNSVALLVKPAPSVLRLPPRVVLKLADRRIEEDWDLDGERDYQERIRSHIETFGAIKSLRRPDEVPPAWRYMLEYWEYRERSHSQERQAYQCLSEAQEMGLVPRFFGSARLMMNERACHPSLTHINGLLVEYIDGRTMASYKPGIDLSPKEAEVISQRVLQLGRDLRRYGVSHNDINVHNVIIRSRNSHPVLIDWGKADTSLANAPLARRWTDHSMWQDFHRDVRWLLRHGGDGDTVVAGGVWHRYRTPVSDAEQCRKAQDAGWGVINSGISGLSDQERERFYEEDESVDSGKGLRWRVRRGVRTRLADDPVPDE